MSTTRSGPRNGEDKSTMTEQQYIAVGGGVPHHALLPDQAVRQWRDLQDALRLSWQSSGEDTRKQVVSLDGCLEKLSASLLQAHRLRNHHDTLLCQAKALKSTPASLAAMRGAETCADFEALLLQGRATLDRLAWHVTSHFKNQSQSFRSMSNVLNNFASKSDEDRRLHEIVREANDWFDGTFGQLEESRSLRDLVAHYHSVTEGVRTCFGINRLNVNTILLLDCEVKLPGIRKSIPVLHTSHESVKWLSYLILNCAAIFMKVETLGVESYEPLWHNRTVVLSDFVSSDPPGSPLGPHTLYSIRAMTLDGFVHAVDNVDPSIYELAVEV